MPSPQANINQCDFELWTGPMFRACISLLFIAAPLQFEYRSSFCRLLERLGTKILKFLSFLLSNHHVMDSLRIKKLLVANEAHLFVHSHVLLEQVVCNPQSDIGWSESWSICRLISLVTSALKHKPIYWHEIMDRYSVAVFIHQAYSSLAELKGISTKVEISKQHACLFVSSLCH
jgi:hypothetical protein